MDEILHILIAIGIGNLVGTIAAIIHIEITQRKRRKELNEI